MKDFMKMHIIGCSGSGKTYLANALSKKHNIPHFDLDDIQWDNSAKAYGTKRPLDKRKALLQEILSNNDWIIEGVYYSWVQQSFDEADKIYVLDMPRYLYKSRIIIRSVKRKFGILKGKKETFRSVCDLLKWTETFQNEKLKEIKRILDRYGNKVVWLSSKKDVEKIIKAGR
jgi:adenylate kinase and related kinases